VNIDRMARVASVSPPPVPAEALAPSPAAEPQLETPEE
jgi:hypothetical protein